MVLCLRNFHQMEALLTGASTQLHTVSIPLCPISVFSPPLLQLFQKHLLKHFFTRVQPSNALCLTIWKERGAFVGDGSTCEHHLRSSPMPCPSSLCHSSSEQDWDKVRKNHNQSRVSIEEASPSRSKQCHKSVQGQITEVKKSSPSSFVGHSRVLFSTPFSYKTSFKNLAVTSQLWLISAGMPADW